MGGIILESFRVYLKNISVMAPVLLSLLIIWGMGFLIGILSGIMRALKTPYIVISLLFGTIIGVLGLLFASIADSAVALMTQKIITLGRSGSWEIAYRAAFKYLKSLLVVALILHVINFSLVYLIPFLKDPVSFIKAISEVESACPAYCPTCPPILIDVPYSRLISVVNSLIHFFLMPYPIMIVLGGFKVPDALRRSVYFIIRIFRNYPLAFLVLFLISLHGLLISPLIRVLMGVIRTAPLIIMLAGTLILSFVPILVYVVIEPYAFLMLTMIYLRR